MQVHILQKDYENLNVDTSDLQDSGILTPAFDTMKFIKILGDYDEQIYFLILLAELVQSDNALSDWVNQNISGNEVDGIVEFIEKLNLLGVHSGMAHGAFENKLVILHDCFQLIIMSRKTGNQDIHQYTPKEEFHLLLTSIVASYSHPGYGPELYFNPKFNNNIEEFIYSEFQRIYWRAPIFLNEAKSQYFIKAVKPWLKGVFSRNKNMKTSLQTIKNSGAAIKDFGRLIIYIACRQQYLNNCNSKIMNVFMTMLEQVQCIYFLESYQYLFEESGPETFCLAVSKRFVFSDQYTIFSTQPSDISQLIKKKIFKKKFVKKNSVSYVEYFYKEAHDAMDCFVDHVKNFCTRTEYFDAFDDFKQKLPKLFEKMKLAKIFSALFRFQEEMDGELDKLIIAFCQEFLY